MPTKVESISALKAHAPVLRALGLDTTEQFVAAARSAQHELANLLNVNMDDLLASALNASEAMSAALEEELAALPCALGAEISGVEPLRDFVPPLQLFSAPGPCGPPLITPAIPIRNQQSRGTCVSFATVAALEYWLHRNGGLQRMSEQFLYWNCKNNDGIPGSSGTWIRVAAQLVQRDGVCTAARWPYNPMPTPGNEAQGPPPAGAQSEALAFRTRATMLPPNSVADIKVALASDRWVPFSIPVYNSWYLSSQVRLTGDITNPIPGEARAGGHAMCIVGCMDLPDRPELGGGRFILRNSWGTAWGRASSYGAGHGTIPYVYIQRFGAEACRLA